MAMSKTGSSTSSASSGSSPVSPRLRGPVGRTCKALQLPAHRITAEFVNPGPRDGAAVRDGALHDLEAWKISGHGLTANTNAAVAADVTVTATKSVLEVPRREQQTQDRQVDGGCDERSDPDRHTEPQSEAEHVAEAEQERQSDYRS